MAGWSDRNIVTLYDCNIQLFHFIYDVLQIYAKLLVSKTDCIQTFSCHTHLSNVQVIISLQYKMVYNSLLDRSINSIKIITIIIKTTRSRRSCTICYYIVMIFHCTTIWWNALHLTLYYNVYNNLTPGLKYNSPRPTRFISYIINFITRIIYKYIRNFEL